MIEYSKNKYYTKISEKLSSISASSKCYWSLLKTMLNQKKIPVIPPLFHNNRFITDFNEKSEIFNSHFASQCSLIQNASTLPLDREILTPNFLNSIDFSTENIRDIIKALDPNKAHGHDKISVRMLKICGDSLCKPLEMIFKDCLTQGTFPTEWKKANVVPIYKKGDKQCVKNYRPVSLLPICSKNL